MDAYLTGQFHEENEQMDSRRTTYQNPMKLQIFPLQKKHTLVY